jgi:hypothetical protein
MGLELGSEMELELENEMELELENEMGCIPRLELGNEMFGNQR